MECIVCKGADGENTYIEALSEEVVLCNECLDEIENGELDGAVLALVQGGD